jgi:hypothetical protein
MQFRTFEGCRGAVSVPAVSPSGTQYFRWYVEIDSLEELIDLVAPHVGIALYYTSETGQPEIGRLK